MGTAVAVPARPFIHAESALYSTFDTLSPVEVETLQAIVARFISIDAHGLGELQSA
jgi:hypothetical protein